MPWIYRCPADGSAQGVWADFEREKAEAAGSDVDFVTCDCGAARVLEFQPGPGGQIIADWPEHSNPAFPVPVRGRRHLKELQRQFGTSDFEPSAGYRERLAESKARLLHGRR